MSRSPIAVLGAGNGGQAFAAHLSLLGHRARLWDVDPTRIDDLRLAGSITASGVVQGVGVPEVITADLGEAVAGAPLVMVVIPAVYHASVAEALARHLREDQVVVLNPGATGGALEVSHILNRQGVRATVAETNTLLYACRSPRPGQVIINGVKDEVQVAALPSRDLPRVVDLIQEAFPQFVGVPNVLHTSLANINAMMHPLPTLLNAARCDTASPFDYYTDGVSPKVAQLLEALDRERLAVALAYGVEVSSVSDWYSRSYPVSGDCLYERVHNNPAYQGIRGPASLDTRYLFEDIPTGLVPLSELGALAGVPTPLMSAVITIGSALNARDYVGNGRNLHRLGLADLSVERIRTELL